MADPLPPDELPASAIPGPSAEALPVRPKPARTVAPWAGVSRRLLAATLVVAIIVSGAVWLDDRRARQELRADIARRLGAVDMATQANTKAESQFATDLRDAQAKIALLEARLAESQQQQASLEALYRDLAPSRDEIVLTEIEQILIIASQQLQLANNVQAALSALQLGEAKLQRMERPQFLPLRRALARDIERLKAVPFVDVSGMSVKLDQAVATIDKLPLSRDERLPPPVAEPPVAEPPGWQRLARDIWNEVRQLVRIEVSERPAAPLVPPNQEYFLRENLKLRLLSARVALLNHEDEAFKADVIAAEAWLRQYFDTRTKGVQTLQAVLKQLVATPTAGGDIPDLARTLDAMRVLRAAVDRTPSRAAGAERSSR